MHHQPQILSPLVEMGASKPESLHSRKISTGGNRSWSEEEEAYLLQTRLQKMPYKHIAAHLKKTELACRLHYHQLSHGSHRRKRNLSMSSTTSTGSAGQSPSSFGMGMDHDAYSQGSLSRHTSPVSYGSNSPPSHHVALTSSSSPVRAPHKIILPKPRTLPNPLTITPRASASPEPPTQLRINTQVPAHAAHYHSSSTSTGHSGISSSITPASGTSANSVDTARLRAIYESRRAQFWSTVAADYGADVDPQQLEHIWTTAHAAVRPPTPEENPEDCAKYGNVGPYGSPASQYDEIRYASPQRQGVLPAPVSSSGRTRAGTWSAPAGREVRIASLLN